MALEEWRIRKVRDFAVRAKTVNVEGTKLPPLSITKGRGVVLQADKYKKQIATDLRKYIVARRDQFAFDPMSLYYGAIGQVVSIEIGLVSPDYVVFEVDDTVDKAFLNYLLRSPEQVAVYETVAETGNQFGKRRRVYWSVFEELEVVMPSLAEQRRIASILSAVDEAIRTTQDVVECLQVVKKALMAELLARGLPGRHSRFELTEIGEVPAAWRVVRVADCLREPIRNGYSPVCSATPTGKWILHLGAVTFDGFEPSAVKHAPPNDPRIDAAALQPGDLLVSRSNTRARVGLAGVYIGEPSPCAYPDLLMRVRTTDAVLPAFLEAALLSERGRRYFERCARGTSESMVKINRDALAGFQFACPSRDEQEEIVEHLVAVKERQSAEAHALESLERLRVALVGALLTGKIRAAVAEDAA